MKRYLSLLLCMMLSCAMLMACGGQDIADLEGEPEEVSEAEQMEYVEEEKLEAAGDTLESRLSLLTKDGWKEKDGAYVYTSDEEGTKGEFAITAKGNDADLTVTFDYGDENSSMADFYKDEPAAGKAICAYWYLRAVAVLDAPEGTENYRLIVGDTEVASGSMTAAEAEEAYDSYFEE